MRRGSGRRPPAHSGRVDHRRVIETGTAGRACDRSGVRSEANGGNRVDRRDRPRSGRHFSWSTEFAIRWSTAWRRLGTEIRTRVIQLNVLPVDPTVDVTLVVGLIQHAWCPSACSAVATGDATTPERASSGRRQTNAFVDRREVLTILMITGVARATLFDVLSSGDFGRAEVLPSICFRAQVRVRCRFSRDSGAGRAGSRYEQEGLEGGVLRNEISDICGAAAV